MGERGGAHSGCQWSVVRCWLTPAERPLADHLEAVGQFLLTLRIILVTFTAGALLFALGRQCWYVYGASDNDHRHLMPNHLMQWEMISWAHSLGCRWYDFRGVSCTPDDPNDKTAGLNRFKRGFGPRFVQYVGEFDLPLNGPAYWAFTKALPRVRAAMKRSRAASAAGEED